MSKFEESKNRLILQAERMAGAYLLNKYASAHLINEPKVELTHTIDSNSSEIRFDGQITVYASDLLNPIVGVNMTINSNDIEIASEDSIADKVENSLNAQQELEPVKASLDGFKLKDRGDGYLLVSHSALEDASIGLVGKGEYAASPDKSILLQTIVKDAMTRVANETKINFTGEFKEPVIELEAKEDDVKPGYKRPNCPGCEKDKPAYEPSPFCKDCYEKGKGYKKSWLTPSLLKTADVLTTSYEEGNGKNYDELREFVVGGGDLRGLGMEVVDMLEAEGLNRNDRELLWHLTPITEDNYGLDEYDWTKDNLVGEEAFDVKEAMQKVASSDTHEHNCEECGDMWKCHKGQACNEGKNALCGKDYAKKEFGMKKSWLTADLMSEDPEPYADSEQLEENENYVLWQTPYADHISYWVSDKEGAELASFNTIEEAKSAMETGEGLAMVDEATMAIKEDMPKASSADHMAQSMQLEKQMVSASQEKIKNEAVNSLVSMLQSMGFGSNKIAEVSMTDSKIDAMVTLDHAGTTKAVNIPVEIKEGKVVLPKKSLVSELINKGLDIRAKLSESFSQEILNKIAAIEEKIAFEQKEAQDILNERPTVTKTANESRNTMFEGDTDTLTLQKHLLPNHQDLKLHDQVSDGTDSWEIVNMNAQQNSKGEDDSSQWTLKKCKKPEADKEPKGKMEL